MVYYTTGPVDESAKRETRYVRVRDRSDTGKVVGHGTYPAPNGPRCIPVLFESTGLLSFYAVDAVEDVTAEREER